MTTPKKTTAKPKTKTESKKATVPLIIETHPVEYTGFPFITLIQYRKQPMLTIVDNMTDDLIQVFALDLCGPEYVDEELVINIASEWYATNRNNFPISFEFSRRGLISQTSKIYRALNIEYVSRVIGPVPKYPMNTTKSIKRRRRKALPSSVETITSN